MKVFTVSMFGSTGYISGRLLAPSIAAVFLFFPIRDRVSFALPFCRRCIVDTSEDEVVAAPSQAAAPTLVIRPSRPVSPPFQELVLPMLLVRFVTLAPGPSPGLLPPPRRHRHWCCWRKTFLRLSAAPSTIAQSVYRPAELIDKKLLILCTRVPTLMIRTHALRHGFDHIHLHLGYFGLRGLSSAWATHWFPL